MEIRKSSFIIILKEQRTMGSSQFKIPKEVREQWVQLVKNGKKMVQNVVTLELFTFQVLSKLKQQQNISKLIERSIYSVPKTPKIIILNDQQGQLFLLVQEFQTTLSKYLQKQRLLYQVLVIMEKVMCVMRSLVKKYGPFHLRDKLIGITSTQDIMMWVNQTMYKNVVSSPIEPSEQSQSIMLCQLMQLFTKNSRVPLFEVKQLNQYRSFDQFQKGLSKIILQKKEELINYSRQEIQKERIIVRALSPQTSFGSQKIGLFKKSNAKDTSSKAEKRNVVPKFVKNMNEKKNGLLDSLRHKRTLTIQEHETIQSSPKRKHFHNNSSRLKSHSKSLSRNRSPKLGSMKDIAFNKSENSSKNIQFQNNQACENLTSSGSSNNYGIQRRKFSSNNLKSCEDLIKDNTEKNGKVRSNPNTPNQPLQSNNYWRQTSESTLFQSFQKNMIPPVSSNASLGLYGGNVAESKHIDDRNDEVIVEEESQCISKTLEEEFNDFFSSGSRSPRFMLGVMNQSVQLAQQFGKIIDF